jgi:hypothetical protein
VVRAAAIVNAILIALLFSAVCGCWSSDGAAQGQTSASTPTPSLEAQADALGEDIDGNDVLYELKLRGPSSPESSLFNAVYDRYWQLRALHEDDEAPASDDQMVILHEKGMIFDHAPCEQPQDDPELYCGDAQGYIYHIQLYAKSPALRAALLNKIGTAWANAFAKFHPHNPHCAMLVVETLGLGRDGQPTDDYGEPIDETHCYAHR